MDTPNLTLDTFRSLWASTALGDANEAKRLGFFLHTQAIKQEDFVRIVSQLNSEPLPYAQLLKGLLFTNSLVADKNIIPLSEGQATVVSYVTGKNILERMTEQLQNPEGSTREYYLLQQARTYLETLPKDNPRDEVSQKEVSFEEATLVDLKFDDETSLI